jgi:hypothetical protein
MEAMDGEIKQLTSVNAALNAARYTPNPPTLETDAATAPPLSPRYSRKVSELQGHLEEAERRAAALSVENEKLTRELKGNAATSGLGEATDLSAEPATTHLSTDVDALKTQVAALEGENSILKKQLESRIDLIQSQESEIDSLTQLSQSLMASINAKQSLLSSATIAPARNLAEASQSGMISKISMLQAKLELADKQRVEADNRIEALLEERILAQAKGLKDSTEKSVQTDSVTITTAIEDTPSCENGTSSNPVPSDDKVLTPRSTTPSTIMRNVDVETNEEEGISVNTSNLRVVVSDTPLSPSSYVSHLELEVESLRSQLENRTALLLGLDKGATSPPVQEESGGGCSIS